MTFLSNRIPRHWSEGVRRFIDRLKPAAAAPRTHPLNLSQQAILAAERMEPDSAALVLARAWEAVGPFDTEAFERAVGALAARHDALRMRVVRSRDGFAAHFREHVFTKPELREIDPTAEGGGEAALDRHLGDLVRAPLPARSDRLWRVSVLRVAPERHIIVLRLHHLIGDDRSMAILARDLVSLYARECGQQGPELPAANSFAASLRDSASRDAGPARAAALPETDLSFFRTDETDPATGRRSNRTTRLLDGPMSAALHERTAEFPLTPFDLIAAAYRIVVERLCDQPDAVISASVSLRAPDCKSDAVGCLSGVVNIAAEPGDDRDFAAIATGMRDKVRACKTAPTHQTGQTGATLSYSDRRLSASCEPAMAIRELDLPVRDLASQLHLGIERGAEGLRLVFEARRARFSPPLLERIADCVMLVVKETLENPHVTPGDLRLVEPGEAARVAGMSVNAHDREFADDIPSRFAQTVRLHPDAPALGQEDDRWRYRDLDAESARLASRLRTSGLGEGDVLGIALPRGAGMVIATLAAHRAGLVVVPLDLDHPAERLGAMCRTAHVAAVLGDGEHDWGAEAGVRDLVLSEVAEIDAPDAPPVIANTDRERVGYILFTSGTTGEPKAIEIPHRAVLGMVVDCVRCPAAPGDRIMQMASPGFDISFDEIWGAWLNGAELIVSPNNFVADGHFVERLRHYRPAVASMTSRLFDLVVDTDPGALGSLRVLSTGGELVSPPHVQRALAANPGLTIYNCYGPTENTGVTTVFRIDGTRRAALPIGRPLRGFAAFVLGEDNQLLPQGFAGELCVGGNGLSHGYLGRPDETARRFITVPKAELGLAGGGGIRLYRTGDRARWNDDGELEFLGRKDTQFKINGHRIEVAEIELAILAMPGVTGAVADPVKRPGEVRPSGIVAYVARATGAGDETALRQHLAGRLPRQMMPSRFVFVDEIPRNTNGKADRVRLRQIAAAQQASAAALSPRDPLVAIWNGFLTAPVASEEADFFLLGGSSLDVVRMLARLESHFGCDLDLADFLADARLARLREMVASADRRGRMETRHLVRLRAGPEGETPVVMVYGILGGIGWTAPIMAAWSAPNAVYGLTFIRRREPNWAPAGFTALIDDLVDDLKRQFGRRRFHLVGYSAGGTIAVALHAAAQKAGLAPELLFLLDTDLQLTNFAGRKGLGYAKGKKRVMFVDALPDCVSLPSDIHFFTAVKAFERPFDGAPGDWALATRAKLFLYQLPTSHTEIADGDSARLVAEHFGHILGGDARPDRVLEGARTSDLLALRFDAVSLARDGDLAAAIALLEAEDRTDGAPPDWLALSLLILYRLAGARAERRRLEQRVEATANERILDELAQQAPNRAARRKRLERLFEASGPRMFGGLRLVTLYCKSGEAARAEYVVARMLANPEIAPAGEFARAVLDGHNGDTRGVRRAMKRAMADPLLDAVQLLWAQRFLKESGETELIRRVRRLGRKRFPAQF